MFYVDQFGCKCSGGFDSILLLNVLLVFTSFTLNEDSWIYNFFPNLVLDHIFFIWDASTFIGTAIVNPSPNFIINNFRLRLNILFPTSHCIFTPHLKLISTQIFFISWMIRQNNPICIDYSRWLWSQNLFRFGFNISNQPSLRLLVDYLCNFFCLWIELLIFNEILTINSLCVYAIVNVNGLVLLLMILLVINRFFWISLWLWWSNYRNWL